METERVLNLLLASAVRDRAASYLRATMPEDLDKAAMKEWRQAHWMEALEQAYTEFTDIAQWIQKRESAGPQADPSP